MARLVTLATLRSRVTQRANIEVASNAALYSASELDDDINEALAELYDLIIRQQDQPYYLSSFPFNTVSNQDTYVIGPGRDIPVADFYKLKGLDISFGQQIVITARPFMWSERNRFKWYPGWIYSQPVFYQLLGKSSGAVATSPLDSIKFIPTPNGQYNCVLWYYPVLARLIQATDTFDGINGFEEHAVLGAAIKMLTKQERFDHVGVLSQEKARQEDRILGMLQTHDAENPMRVQDVTLNDGWIGRPGY